MCIFGVTKKVIRFNQIENCKIQTQHIGQILEGVVRAATPMNIASPFRNGRIDRAFDTGEIVAAAMAEEDDSKFEPEGEEDEHSVTELTV
jgi:hypothetical protein